MNTEKAAVLQEVNEHIQIASQMLKSLGSHYERVGWILEDTLEILLKDESLLDADAFIDSFPTLSDEMVEEDATKQVFQVK